jgi:VanZ family protein
MPRQRLPWTRSVLASRILTVWLPVVAWAALIFVLSAQPDLTTGLGTWDTILRKLAHVVEYVILGALLVRALTAPVPALAAGIAYAISDELHQAFVPGRYASALDVAIDSVGVVLGVLLYERYGR